MKDLINKTRVAAGLEHVDIKPTMSYKGEKLGSSIVLSEKGIGQDAVLHFSYDGDTAYEEEL